MEYEMVVEEPKFIQINLQQLCICRLTQTLLVQSCKTSHWFPVVKWYDHYINTVTFKQHCCLGCHEV